MVPIKFIGSRGMILVAGPAMGDQANCSELIIMMYPSLASKD